MWQECGGAGMVVAFNWGGAVARGLNLIVYCYLGVKHRKPEVFPSYITHMVTGILWLIPIHYCTCRI